MRAMRHSMSPKISVVNGNLLAQRFTARLDLRKLNGGPLQCAPGGECRQQAQRAPASSTGSAGCARRMRAPVLRC